MTHRPEDALKGSASAPAAPVQKTVPDAGPATPPAASGSAIPKGTLVPLFIGLMLAMLLASLNQTVFSTALPTIVGELNGVSSMVWVITAFILATTIAMPIYGKLGDQIGRKPLLIFAISVFMAGSVVGGLAPDMGTLIVARVIQGLGGGGLMILSQAAIADVVPARERGKYMGIMGGVFALSSVIGPLLGGWFTDGPGWRWAFWINLPIGVVALLAAIVFLKLPRNTQGRPTLDWGGMALIAVATTAMVLVTTWGGGTYAWTDPIILGLAALFVLAAVGFVLVERRTAEPLIPMTLFRERNFVLTTISGLFIGVAMFGALGYMPTYLQMSFGLEASVAGLMMIPMMGAMLITSTVSGQLVSKYGKYKWYPVVGAFIIAISMGLLSLMDPHQPVWVACTYLGLLGIGLGLSMQILVLVVQNTFPISMVGTATASNNYFRQIGATLGSSLVGSLFAARLANLFTERLPADGAGQMGSAESLTPDVIAGLPEPLHDTVITAYSDALTPIFLWIAPLGVIAAVLLMFLKQKPLATRIERSVEAEPLATGSMSIVSAEAARATIPAQAGEGRGVDESQPADQMKDRSEVLSR
ncbi:MDR family MFS transporter [Citricoccus muralis]|uniref:EmrB/QacA subfamily drug resistance transporter n=1 Tax=Citricoccus muralis TaxID=169134 RepID=A0A3D9LE54_9MICC|nr:MDR family MFS transporter [Citricoccus muralis]REE04719.1 EmrB/QacA subfamily drug resistance transporter [Citricoccus muralis]